MSANETTTQNTPLVWLVDSERNPLSECLGAFTPWAETLHIAHGTAPDWAALPDAIFFSAEIPGGPQGQLFADLLQAAGPVPLLAVARLRSLAQAVAYFRTGAADYLSLPLEEDDAHERFDAALQRSTDLAMQGVMVELEPVDQDLAEISLSLRPSTPEEPEEAAEEEDILAHLQPPPPPPVPPVQEEEDNDEPEPVDGLPIPTLWEELPCGLLVFDSSANLVFANSFGLELFGHTSLAELQETLETHRSDLDAHAANHHPLPDNQWPHIIAAKTRTARSAVVSIVKPDGRRSWLRIDCLPHLADGTMSRLSMTLVNLTGELPPLRAREGDLAAAPAKKDKAKKRGRKHK